MSTESPEQAGTGGFQRWQIVYVGEETFRPADYIPDDGPLPIAEGAVIELAPDLGSNWPGKLNEFDDIRCREWCEPRTIVVPLPTGKVEIPVQVCRPVCGIPPH